GEINYDLLSALKPDLVLLDAKNGVSPMEKRLEQMGVPYLYIDDWNENSPLGKAEWMMAVAESVGRRNEAEEVFREIPEKYNALKQRVSGAA
ncbi:MAG: ABC transporter substrate-binding protein, partial [Muribaculaceae bacterium]|nr:ABC transporter substrate-binding protein [Muribaculaceae bacterium]